MVVIAGKMEHPYSPDELKAVVNGCFHLTGLGEIIELELELDRVTRDISERRENVALERLDYFRKQIHRYHSKGYFDEDRRDSMMERVLNIGDVIRQPPGIKRGAETGVIMGLIRTGLRDQLNENLVTCIDNPRNWAKHIIV